MTGHDHTTDLDPQWIETANRAADDAIDDVFDFEVRNVAQAVLRAVAPLIAERAAAAALTNASQTLTDWAAECGTDPARRMRRLTLEAAARKILPRMTTAEAATAFMDVLTGRAPGFVCGPHETDAAIGRRTEND